LKRQRGRQLIALSAGLERGPPGSVDAQHLLEDSPTAIQGNRVLHLRYRVRR
jgi:hypothetical protein